MSSLYRGVKIGSVELEGNLFLAPTAGFSDMPFRSICSELGSDMNFTEMVSCEALIRNNPRTEIIMAPAEEEKYRAIQIFTGNAETAAKAVPWVLKFNPAVIDINCGCPVPKILKSGAGSALMKTPEKIRDIVRAVKNETDVPVTVKIRSGFDFESINFLECASLAVEGGASMVSLHPRTKTQGYSGKANWDHIKELKESISVPVAGSGDLYTPDDAKNMLESTGCDAVMFARGIFGNPWLFPQTRELLTTGVVTTIPGAKERMDMAFHHLELSLKCYPEHVALKEIKKHLCAYTKGVPGASKARNELVHCSTFEEYKEVFEGLTFHS